MDDLEDHPRHGLEAFVQSVRDSRDETRRLGIVSPDDVERSADEAISRGLKRRERERHAGRGASSR